jgi:hypothetical protein
LCTGERIALHEVRRFLGFLPPIFVREIQTGIVGNSNILASIFNRVSYHRGDIFFKSRRRAIFENSPKNRLFLDKL